MSLVGVDIRMDSCLVEKLSALGTEAEVLGLIRCMAYLVLDTVDYCQDHMQLPWLKLDPIPSSYSARGMSADVACRRCTGGAGFRQR